MIKSDDCLYKVYEIRRPNGRLRLIGQTSTIEFAKRIKFNRDEYNESNGLHYAVVIRKKE